MRYLAPGVEVWNDKKKIVLVFSLLLILLSDRLPEAACRMSSARRNSAQRIHRTATHTERARTRHTTEASSGRLAAEAALAEGARLRSEGKATLTRKAI